jgi:hypothetical protein
MALLSSKLDQFFILLVPELVVWFEVVSDLNFPREPDFVQNYLSILSNCVIVTTLPLLANPMPQRLILLVTLWHHAIAIASFIFDQLFVLLVPELVVVVVVGNCPNEPDVVQKSLSIKSNSVRRMKASLLVNPNP